MVKIAEMIWKIGVDTNEAKQAGKAFAKNSESNGNGGGTGAFAGGVIGSLLGSLLSSVKMLFDPLSAVATLLVMALFPILKPFLILFIKVGLLLYKFLNKSLAGLGGTGEVTQTDDGGFTTVRDNFVSGLFVLGAILGGIIASLVGAPALLTAGIVGLSAFIVSVIGKKVANALLKITKWLDNTFNTNLLKPLKRIFQGISDTFNGLWNTILGILHLDWQEIWEGFKQTISGLNDILGGIGDFMWETLVAIFKISFVALELLGTWIYDSIVKILGVSWDALVDLGTWIYDGLTDLLTTSFDALKGIGTWIYEKIKGMFSLFGGGSDTKVNDAIITPNGDIIRTNPSDYLIATKNPSALGGGSSGNATLNVTINGGLITEEVAKDIGKIIQRESNYGGGF